MYLWICLIQTTVKIKNGNCANTFGSAGEFLVNHTNSGGGKIINGTTATPHKFPSMLLLQFLDEIPKCAATIVDKYWAVTAAHCTAGNPSFPNITRPTGFSLIAGVHDVRMTESHIQNVTVTQVIPHKLYGTAGFGYDIALLKVEPPFLFTTKVAPVNLPDCNFRVEMDRKVVGYAAGWGSQWPFPNPPPHIPFLQEVDLPLVTTETCQQAFGWVQTAINNYSTAIDEDDVICSGYKEGGKDVCGGDSGGPLFVYNDEDRTYTQVGIVAWGKFPCALPNFYGVYTMLSKYLDWMKWNMKNCKTKASGAGRALQKHL